MQKSIAVEIPILMLHPINITSQNYFQLKVLFKLNEKGGKVVLLKKIRSSQKFVYLKVLTTWFSASQGFLDPIQKRALSRSVHLEAVYLEALLYNVIMFLTFLGPPTHLFDDVILEWSLSSMVQRVAFYIWDGCDLKFPGPELTQQLDTKHCQKMSEMNTHSQKYLWEKLLQFFNW